MKVADFINQNPKVSRSFNWLEILTHEWQGVEVVQNERGHPGGGPQRFALVPTDGLEIKCDSGQTASTTFAKNYSKREGNEWRSWDGKGLPGETVREMLIEAVERRFGSV